MKVWTETKTGNDGLKYSVRYLLEDDELSGLQNAGVIGSVYQIVGMQEAADSVIAGFEKQIYTSFGGQVQ